MRVFDTSFIIDLSNNDAGATKLAQSVDEEHSVAAISVISVHEYIFGIYNRYFQGKELLETKLGAAEKELLSFMIMPLTEEIAKESARLQAMLAKRGLMIGINDIYIAATALVHGATLVTRNSSAFRRVEGLSVEKY